MSQLNQMHILGVPCEWTPSLGGFTMYLTPKRETSNRVDIIHPTTPNKFVLFWDAFATANLITLTVSLESLHGRSLKKGLHFFCFQICWFMIPLSIAIWLIIIIPIKRPTSFDRDFSQRKIQRIKPIPKSVSANGRYSRRDFVRNDVIGGLTSINHIWPD